MKQRIYIGTSIVGGFFDKEFAEPTRALFAKLECQETIFVRIRRYNSVNLKMGYATLEIRNPRELIDYEN